MPVKRDYEILKDMSLPRWLEDQLPEPLPCLHIFYESGAFYLSHSPNDLCFGNIMDAYEYATRFEAEFQIVFDPSVNGHGGNLDGVQFYADGTHFETQKPHKFLLAALDTNERMFGLKYSYFNWLTGRSMAYNDDPEDFYHAYNFLTHHPLFWIKPTTTRSYDWKTSQGLQSARMNVSNTREELLFSLSHGGHRRTDYTNYYRDPKMVGYGRTYEEAVISLADKVNRLYDLDGYARPDPDTKH